MNFSLILNTRKRVPLLKSLLESIQRKTHDLSKVEVLIRFDDDDKDTEVFKMVNQARNGNLDEKFPFKFYIGPRNRNLHKNINFLAKESKGRFIFVLNDDTEILTNNWDSRALENINSFKVDNNIKDDIIYGFTHDTSVDKATGKNYASFPIISKQAVNVLGFFMHEEFVGLGADAAIFRVYKCIERVVDTKIALDHIYHNSFQKIMNPDLVAMEMRQYTIQHPVDPDKFDISTNTNKLKSFISSYV